MISSIQHVLHSIGRLSVLIVVSGLLFTSAATAHGQLPDQRIVIDRVALPAGVAVIFGTQSKYYGRAIKVGRSHPQSVQIDRIQLHPRKLVLVGHRIVHQRHSLSPVWLERVKITIPGQYLSSSWDVRSLQKELDRLGIKIKPKPAPPKPTQLSG